MSTNCKSKNPSRRRKLSSSASEDDLSESETENGRENESSSLDEFLEELEDNFCTTCSKDWRKDSKVKRIFGLNAVSVKNGHAQNVRQQKSTTKEHTSLQRLHH